MDLHSATQTAVPLLTQFVLKLVGAGAAGFAAPEPRVLVRSRS